MTTPDERRKAGRNFKSLYQAMADTHESISQMLRSFDAILQQREPPWICNYSAVTWDNSASLGQPRKWVPRLFGRAWLRRDGDENWNRAVALYVQAHDEQPEPWVLCALLETLDEQGLGDTGLGAWWSWIWRLGDANVLRWNWVPGREDQAFAWSSPSDEKKVPVRACGYYLHLTDLESADDLVRLVVDPLLSLHDGWDEKKLPADLPTWA
ncbi:MAG: hypothetical protein IT348_10975 [Candidatus Eisenbacteria bacterium]|nr:hypothetical protein [Candidatus Eisenbacteria bacterium]